MQFMHHLRSFSFSFENQNLDMNCSGISNDRFNDDSCQTINFHFKDICNLKAFDVDI